MNAKLDSHIYIYTDVLFDLTVQWPLRLRLCILKYNIILQIVIQNEPNYSGFIVLLLFFLCCHVVYEFAVFKLDKK